MIFSKEAFLTKVGVDLLTSHLRAICVRLVAKIKLLEVSIWFWNNCLIPKNSVSNLVGHGPLKESDENHDTVENGVWYSYIEVCVKFQGVNRLPILCPYFQRTFLEDHDQNTYHETKYNRSELAHFWSHCVSNNRFHWNLVMGSGLLSKLNSSTMTL